MTAAEIFSLVSMIAFALAGIFLVIALFFFFKFKIVSIIGDLSGRTARRSIAKMRAENEENSAGEAAPANNKYKKTAGVGNKSRKAARSDAGMGVKPKAGRKQTAGGTTQVLAYTENAGTQLLQGTERLNMPEAQQTGGRTDDNTFELVQSIVLIHTTETI